MSLLFVAGIGATVNGGAVAFSAGSQAASHRTDKPSRSTNSSRDPVSTEVDMPFRIGEKLDYRIAWASFANAASVQLTVPERRELTGWGTWHFRASAHTMSLMRSLITVDDQFDSYTDTATLESRQYEWYLNEMGTKENRVLHFLPQGRPAGGNSAGIVVSPGTHDPLGALYAMRGVDWRATPVFKVPVYDGHDVYEMRARMEVPSETVAVEAGNYAASKISIRLFQRGKEVPGMSFVAWMAHDTARTPILLEAELPMGNLRAELVSASQ